MKNIVKFLIEIKINIFFSGRSNILHLTAYLKKTSVESQCKRTENIVFNS